MNPKIYHPVAGSHIDDVCMEATALAIKLNRQVTFDFNGATVLVEPTDSWPAVLKRLQSILYENQKAYEASSEYTEILAERNVRLRAAQKETDDLIRVLPNCLDREIDLIKWVGKFVVVTDHIGVKVDREYVHKLLESRGYAKNAHLNQPKDYYQIPGNFAGYIIGQFMDYPHPNVISRFCNDYVNRFSPQS